MISCIFEPFKERANMDMMSVSKFSKSFHNSIQNWASIDEPFYLRLQNGSNCWQTRFTFHGTKVGIAKELSRKIEKKLTIL
jgi:hypothetical protein